MKQTKKIGLSLNKKVISNLALGRITGGSSDTGTTAGNSLQGGCGTAPRTSTVPSCYDE
nr:hypothetical protein [Allomuricauda sp.]